MGTIFDIKKFAIHDGPGIRTTVFLKGCSLSCPWCHNPESQLFEREALYRAGRCALCGACIAACDAAALSFENGAVARDASRCVLCGSCAAACPSGARELVGREAGVEEVLAAVLADRVFYEESGGGVTFSGGEPLEQPDFLAALLHACRGEGIHTAVDTSGHAPAATLDRLARDVDLFLYDLKLMDASRHREWCGVSNEPILRNLRALCDGGRSVLIRFPYVPGVNDDRANIEALGAFAASLPGRPGVDILPYERLGVEKYARLGRTCRLAEVKMPADAAVAAAAAALRACGVNVTVRGERA